MVFLLDAKKKLGKAQLIDSNSVAVNKNGVTFGTALSLFIGQRSYIEIYRDDEKGLVAFKPSQDKTIGYKVITKNLKTVYYRRLYNTSVRGQYRATLSNGMIVISIR